MSPETFAGARDPHRPYAGMRGGLYARKSEYRGKKNSRKRSVAEQLTAGRADAERLGVQVGEQGEYVDDGVSASRHAANRERGDFERLLDDIEHKRLGIVFAWASTRLQRDLAVYVRLRDACAAAGVLWCYGGKVYDLSNKDDRFRTGLDALVGEREVDELRDNVMRALRSNAVAGRPQGRAPYGYRRVYDAKTGAYLQTEPEPDEAKIVEEICERVAAGQAYVTIARDLNARGVTPPTEFWSSKQVERASWMPVGEHPAHAEIRAEVIRRFAKSELPVTEIAKEIAKDFNEREVPLIMARWYPATITQFASDPRYLGVRTHHGIATNTEAWPRITDPSTHAQCLAVIDKRRKVKTYNTRPGRAKYLLPGNAVCDDCSAPLFSGVNGAKKTATRQGTRKRRLNCMAPGVDGKKGYHVSFDMELADDHVKNELFDWLASPGFIEAYVKSDEERAGKVSDAEGEIKVLTARLESFRQSAINGTMSAESFAVIEAGILPKIAEAEKTVMSLRVPSVVRGIAGATREEIATAWEQIDLPQQRLIVETLLEVRIKPVGRGIKPESAAPYVLVRPRKLAAAA
ncbi:recombinase family protein [Kitasatospora sp. NPDC004614]|uniref:recombinase family protein n=1 Tax=unclassified Kitasatospora TaxID=2633591 RepID=UPI00368426FE